MRDKPRNYLNGRYIHPELGVPGENYWRRLSTENPRSCPYSGRAGWGRGMALNHGKFVHVLGARGGAEGWRCFMEKLSMFWKSGVGGGKVIWGVSGATAAVCPQKYEAWKPGRGLDIGRGPEDLQS